MAKSIVTTICRTIAIVAVWTSAPSFLSSIGPLLGTRMDREAGPVYLIALIIIMFGAITATAMLWLGGRPKQRVLPRADRAFPVVPPTSSDAKI